MNPQNWVALVMMYTENDTALVCYMFNIYRPILITFAGTSYGVWSTISLYNFLCLFATISLICCKIVKAEIMHFWCHWLFVNMPFTKEDKILFENLFELKGYDAKHLVRKYSSKGWNVGSIYRLFQKLKITESVDHRPSYSWWHSTRTDDNKYLVDELVLHKNGQVKINICTLYLIQLFCVQILSKLVNECQNIVSFLRQYPAWLKDPISRVDNFPGSAEMLIRRGGITNHHSIRYSLSNISAKNYHSWSICIKSYYVQHQCHFYRAMLC